MRQWSAFDHANASKDHPGTPTGHPSHAQVTSRTPRMAPRLTLPQRPVIVDSTLAETFDSQPTSTPKSKRPRRAKTVPVQPMPASTALTSPLEVLESPSPDDLQLIPPSKPNSRSARSKHRWTLHGPSPRLNLLKLSLVGVVLFSVLAATLATAGGGSVANLLFSALHNAVPYAPAAATPALATQRVHPIIQADKDAGYDSLQQHDLYWNAACSAAALTEVLHAWGLTSITLGRIIDEMSATNPPYITPWGGLMSQNGWTYEGQLHHLHVSLKFNQAMSYDDMVRLTMIQGIPVIVGVVDNGGLYYPAFGVGHFLVVVGGDASGLYIVDSSLYRITYLPRDEFTYLWAGGRGETVVFTPG